MTGMGGTRMGIGTTPGDPLDLSNQGRGRAEDAPGIPGFIGTNRALPIPSFPWDIHGKFSLANALWGEGLVLESGMLPLNKTWWPAQKPGKHLPHPKAEAVRKSCLEKGELTFKIRVIYVKKRTIPFGNVPLRFAL